MKILPTPGRWTARLRLRVKIARSNAADDASSLPIDSDAGDTLVEVLIALLVLSIAAVALLLAFGTALTSSGEHRTLTSIAVAEKDVSQQIIAQLENANPALYLSCAAPSAYQTGSNAVSFTNLPKGYSALISKVSYWVPTAAPPSFTASQAGCVSNQPQLVTATLTTPMKTTSLVTAVVSNPSAPTSPPAGAANKLVFTTEPGGALSAQPFGPQPVVEIVDSSGNVVQTDLSDVVLTLTSSTGGTLSGGVTLSSSCIGSENLGVVTFSGCSVAVDGTYTLTATDASLPPGTSTLSSTFTVSIGPASQILFTQQPSSTTGGIAFTPQPQLTVRDAGGNVVTTDSSTVSLAITHGTPSSGGPGTLSANCTQSGEASGVISFTGCSVNTKGTNYTLTATDVEPGGTLTATSAMFTISTGAPAQLAFTQTPGASSTNTSFTLQPRVSVEDAGGNVVTTGTGSTDKITIAIDSGGGTGSGTLSCTNTGNLTVNADRRRDYVLRWLQDRARNVWFLRVERYRCDPNTSRRGKWVVHRSWDRYQAGFHHSARQQYGRLGVYDCTCGVHRGCRGRRCDERHQ